MTRRWRTAAPGTRNAPPTALRVRDVGTEILASLASRPVRTVLTMLGTVLGIGSLVVILGLTSTGSGQVADVFATRDATQVIVRDAGGSLGAQGTVDDLPADSEHRLAALNGVVSAGLTWRVSEAITASTSLRAGAPTTPVAVAAATPAYLRTAEMSLIDGAAFNELARERSLPVAVVGAGVARRLDIANAARLPTIFLDGHAFAVVGVIGGAARDPNAGSTVYIPDTTARAAFGDPLAYSPASVLVHTEPGAASVVAQQAPLALRPDRPELISASAAVASTRVRAEVMGSIDGIFVALAITALLVGAVGIANTTLVSVIERTREIGLRRALGARPRHIAAQLLGESAAVGTLGGLIGTALGIAVVLAVAVLRHWTAILEPTTTLAAPFLGTITGVLAGVYPAMRASRIQPLEALRR